MRFQILIESQCLALSKTVWPSQCIRAAYSLFIQIIYDKWCLDKSVVQTENGL